MNIYTLEDKPENFKYQLTNKMDKKEDLISAIEPFAKYNALDEVILVQIGNKYALFTEGKNIWSEDSEEYKNLLAERWLKKKLRELKVKRI